MCLSRIRAVPRLRNAGVAYVGGLHGHRRVREGSQAGAGGALTISACLIVGKFKVTRHARFELI